MGKTKPQLGFLYDSVNCKPIGSTIFEPHLDDRILKTDMLGNIYTCGFDYVDSFDSLCETLNVDANVKFSGLVNTYSAKASFANEVAMSSNSICLIGWAKVESGSIQYDADDIGALSLKDSVNYNERDYWSFRNRYGDSLITGITFGSELYFVLTIKTAYKKEHTEIKTALKGKTFKWSAAAEMNSEIDRLSKKYEMHINYLQIGQSFELKKVDIDSLKNNILKFMTNLEPEKGRVIDFSLTEFVNISSFPDGKFNDKIKVALERQRKLAIMYSKYEEIEKDICYIEYAPEAFEKGSKKIKELEKTKKIVKNQMEKILVLRKKLMESPDIDMLSIEDPIEVMKYLPSPRKNLPTRAKDIAKANKGGKDKLYTIYIHGDYRQKAEIYCKNMNSEIPEEYIVVDPETNYTCLKNTTYLKGKELITHFKKIRINLKTMEVDCKNCEEQTTGGPLEVFKYTDSGPEKDDSRVSIKKADFCIAISGSGAGNPSYACFDLSNTPFRISKDVEFKAGGYNPWSNIEFDKEGERKKGKLMINGAIGTIRPSIFKLIHQNAE